MYFFLNMLILRSFLFFLIALILPTIAYGDTVHIKCKAEIGYIDDNKKEIEDYTVNIDSINNKVSHVKSNGKIFELRGLFAANEITYSLKYSVVNILEVTETYQVNRVNLKVLGLRKTYNKKFQTTSEELINGECIVVEIPDRKI